MDRIADSVKKQGGIVIEDELKNMKNGKVKSVDDSDDDDGNDTSGSDSDYDLDEVIFFLIY